MRNLNLVSVAAMIVMLVAAGCGNKTQDQKIADLQKKIEELEAGKTPSQKATTAEPEVKPEGPLPAFSFEEEEFDFGDINQGDVVEHVFVFTNTGEAPLLITDAKATCGCTVPDYPKEPIAVGQTSQMKVRFDSKNKKGQQNKTVTITANTYPSETQIKIKAQVAVSPEAEEAK